MLELPNSFKILEKSEYSIFTKNKIHPYFASFHPSIPGTMIELFTKKDDVVLDPFCGSGTTLLQSGISSRNSIGYDANPIACLISKVRTTKIHETKLQKKYDLINSIENDITDFYKNKNQTECFFEEVKIPKFHNIDSWFKKEVQIELGIIKKHIEKLNDKDFSDVCKVAFSNIIVKVSNQSHETQYARKEKKYQPNEALLLFQSKLENIIDEVKLYRDLIGTHYCKIICQDLRKDIDLERKSIDAVITSPPYLNAWDYHLYQRFRMFWLDFEPRKLRDIEIGAHLTHYQDPDAIEKYCNDMKLCLQNMFDVLKMNKRCGIVIGDSIVHRKIVNIGNLLERIGKKIGFTVEKNYRQNIFGPHFSLKQNKATKSESILIFKKI